MRQFRAGARLLTFLLLALSPGTIMSMNVFIYKDRAANSGVTLELQEVIGQMVRLSTIAGESTKLVTAVVLSPLLALTRESSESETSRVPTLAISALSPARMLVSVPLALCSVAIAAEVVPLSRLRARPDRLTSEFRDATLADRASVAESRVPRLAPSRGTVLEATAL